jgi:hypothetical protein
VDLLSQVIVHSLFTVRGAFFFVFAFFLPAPVAFGDWKWISDALFARTWGRWISQLHHHSRAYAQTHSDRAARVRNWDTLHDSILQGAAIHPDDAAVVENPDKFGVLHGDLNIRFCDADSYCAVDFTKSNVWKVSDLNSVRRVFFSLSLPYA